MKTIEPVQIWYNGQIKTASVLNANASVNLNQDAYFYYSLISLDQFNNLSETIASGSIYMNQETYETWTQDVIAWDFIASQLNLVITGDYIAPQPVIVEESVIEAPVEEYLPQSPSNSL